MDIVIRVTATVLLAMVFFMLGISVVTSFSETEKRRVNKTVQGILIFCEIAQVFGVIAIWA